MTKSESQSRIFNHELKLRVISALVMAAVVLGMTWIGGTTYSLLWAVLAIAIFFEFSRICGSAIPYAIFIFAVMALFLTLIAYHTGSQDYAVWIAMMGVIALGVWEMVLKQSAWGAIGLAYATLPFLALSDLRSSDLSGLVATLVLFACVWGADIFAFFFGRALGGPKLAPAISPKKTWSGFVGGLLGAILLSSLIAYFSGFSFGILFIGLMVLLALVTQIGDLMESSLKRYFDVKDSGSMIPGHGGVLDRIDGLILAGAILWLVLKSIQLIKPEYSTPSLAFADMFLMKP